MDLIGREPGNVINRSNGDTKTNDSINDDVKNFANNTEDHICVNDDSQIDDVITNGHGGDRRIEAPERVRAGENNNNNNDVKSSNQTRVFCGCLVHSTLEQDMVIMENAAIGVKGGKIIFVEPLLKLETLLTQHDIPKQCIVQLTSSQFLMPGLVDCHAHAPQYSFLGTGAGLQLLDWLNTYTFPAEARLKEEPDHGLGLYLKCVERTLKCGTTTISYYATIHRESAMALVDAMDIKGQRGFVGKVNMDINGPDNYIETTTESIGETEKFISGMHQRKSSLVQACITPRFALACSMPLQTQLGSLAHMWKLPIQTHMSENPDEVKAVLKTFPQCTSYADVYNKAGLLGGRTMLAHFIHTSMEELEIIRNSGSGICHCPNSNFNLSSGIMDLATILAMGIKVGLGTDFAGGTSPSMFDAIRRGLDVTNAVSFSKRNPSQNEDHAISDKLNSGPITYKQLFKLATLGSSQVMGLDDVIGNFTVGKDFDALLVDTGVHNSPFDVFPTDTKEDVVQKLIFQGDDRNIVKVFVQGRQVVGSD